MAVLVPLTVLLASCAPVSSQAPTAPSNAVLEVVCPVPDAMLWVDGRYIAQLRDLRGGAALAPGHHQIELRHEHFHAYYGEIDLATGEHLRIEVHLAEVLP